MQRKLEGKVILILGPNITFAKDLEKHSYIQV